MIIERAFMEQATDLAVMPCVTAFKRMAALPLDVRGPVERCALRRLAASCRAVAIWCSK